ncbi:MAG: hypothetical protein AAFV74_02330 [Pseudomonadota bacterium]
MPQPACFQALRRVPFWVVCAASLSACAGANDLDGRAVYLGDFKLGHNVVIAPNAVKGPASREATGEEWIEAVSRSVDARFSRYEGARFVNLGISIDGYVLAVTGVPLVAAPRSALIIRVTAWNDAEGKKFNEAPKLITVVEDLSPDTALSSGLTQTKEEQIENLSVNAAKLIEKWLVEQNEEFGWLEPDGVPAKDKDTPRFQPGIAPPVVDPPEDADVAPDTETATAPDTETATETNPATDPTLSDAETDADPAPADADPTPVVEDPAPVT